MGVRKWTMKADSVVRARQCFFDLSLLLHTAPNLEPSTSEANLLFRPPRSSTRRGPLNPCKNSPLIHKKSDRLMGPLMDSRAAFLYLEARRERLGTSSRTRR